MSRSLPIGLAALIAASALTKTASADDDVSAVVAVELGASLAEPSLLAGVEGGVRINGEWSVLLEVDWNPLFSIAGPDVITPGLLNVGVGFEHIYEDGLLRFALFVGTSTLLFQTLLDGPGSTGIFFDLVPISIRVPIEEGKVTLRIDPVSGHLLAPVLSGLPLLRYEFRHVLSIEVTP